MSSRWCREVLLLLPPLGRPPLLWKSESETPRSAQICVMCSFFVACSLLGVEEGEMI